MIVSDAKEGVTILEGTPFNLTQEAINIFGGMLEETPEILLVALMTYVDEIDKLNPDDYKDKLTILKIIADIAKKSFKAKEKHND